MDEPIKRAENEYDLAVRHLRKRLLYVLRKFGPFGLTKVARDMGITAVTLGAFCKSVRNPHIMVFCKIKNWVINKEKQEGIIEQDNLDL